MFNFNLGKKISAALNGGYQGVKLNEMPEKVKQVIEQFKSEHSSGDDRGMATLVEYSKKEEKNKTIYRATGHLSIHGQKGFERNVPTAIEIVQDANGEVYVNHLN